MLGSYLHGTRIGVLVELAGGDGDLARDIAMHVAASRPLCVSADQVPAEQVTKEKEIFAAQAATSGKPANIVEKMVEGRLRKYFDEITLLGQPFVRTLNKAWKTCSRPIRPERSVSNALNSVKGSRRSPTISSPR